MKHFMVLNDGETYTSLEGCNIVSLPDYVDDDSAAVFIERGEGKIEFSFIESEGGIGIIQAPTHEEYQHG